MMDFTGVKAITIPEGSVTKIMRGSEVLWEKPSSGGEYTFIDSIDLAGNQVLTTAIKPKSSDYIHIDFAPLVDSGYGNFVSAGSSKVMRFWADGSPIVAKIDWYNQSFATMANGVRLTAAMNKQKIFYNGSQAIDMSGVPAFTADTALSIGGVPMRLWGCKHGTSSDALDMDYVPAIRNSDGAAGLYDNVSGTFAAIGTASA